MPIGSSICMVSVQVQAMRLDRAIMTPGSFSRLDMAAYSPHHPSGSDRCRNASLSSRVERQSDVCSGTRTAPRTLNGTILAESLCNASSASVGVRVLATQLVNSVRSGVAVTVANAGIEFICLLAPNDKVAQSAPSAAETKSGNTLSLAARQMPAHSRQ